MASVSFDPPPTTRLSKPAALAGAFRRLAAHPLLILVFVANAGLVAGIWVRHADSGVLSSPAAVLAAVTEISALVGSYLAVVGLILVARVPFVDHVLGDRTAHYHRLLGLASIVLIGLQVGAAAGGYTLLPRFSFLDELSARYQVPPYVLASLVAFALAVLAGLGTMKLAGLLISSESRSGLRPYAYTALALAFGHQLVFGTDFTTHSVAWLYWIGLHAVAAFSIMVFRVVAPMAGFFRHRFRIYRICIESPGMISVYVAGRSLDRLNARAGQYFRLRILARREWRRSHRFSVSAVPDGRSLRFTIESPGGFSGRLPDIRPGTRVLLEGPYGALTSEWRTRDRVALIGAGTGISPMRALFEELAGKADVRLIYRAPRVQDLAFFDELARLQHLPGTFVTYLVGRRGSPALPEDSLGPDAIERLVPDIRSRDVFICGPAATTDALERSLRKLKVPRRRIHSERLAA